jgi:hypothetical protein
MYQILFRPEVAFGRLHRCVPKEQLDLLQFATRCTAQFRACPSQVVRCDSGHACCGRIAPKELPDYLLAKGNALRLSTAAHGPKD